MLQAHVAVAEQHEGAQSPEPDASFELIMRSPTETVATAGDCLLVIIRRTISANGVHAIGRGFQQLEAAYGRFGYLSLVEAERVSAMDAGSRNLMADLIRKHTRQIAGASFVVEGAGFRATAVRSLLTAIHMASRAAHPMQAFSTLDAALEWYAEIHPERQRDTAGLGRALNELRARSA